MPVGKQGRAKARNRSVPISGPGDDEQDEQVWRCPPLDECEKLKAYPIALESPTTVQHRVVVQPYESVQTQCMVRFSLIQQVHYQGGWRDVVEVDTVHDVDVHLHQYCRSTGHRNGNDPEVIHEVHSAEDIDVGYTLAYDRVFNMWQENHRRWRDG